MTRRGRAARGAAIAAAAAAGLVVLLAAAGYLHLRATVPDYDRDAVLDGLEAPVLVHRDRFGIPHVQAASEADLFRAMGYLHAQDRLWQMELFRRTADGRLAEAFGADYVEADRFLRTVGLGRAAARALERTPEDEVRLLQAYADGVNALIDRRRRAPAPEFALLRLRPEPWTVRNTLSVAALMAWDLTDWRTGRMLQRAHEELGEERARQLLPRYPSWGPVKLPSDGPAAPPSELPPGPVPAGRPPGFALEAMARGGAARGSNAWAVAGDRTESGHPILAGDMHLGLSAPPLWYLAALDGGRIRAAGMTIPGSPFVLSGRTPAVAWAMTYSMIPGVEFVIEEIDEDDRHRVGERWVPLAVREERIAVRGGDAVTHRVRSTRNGPIITDVVDPPAAGHLAMRWAFADGPGGIGALLEMGTAGSAAELDAAVAGFDAMNLNVLYADTAGEIGYRLVGRIAAGDRSPRPVARDAAPPAGVYLVPDALPSARASEGVLMSANHRILGDDHPLRLQGSWAPPYRALRIAQVLEEGGPATFSSSRRAQLDTRDLMAARNRIHAARAARAAGLPEAAAALSAWDGTAGETSPEAALYYLWFDRLRRSVNREVWDGAERWMPRAVLDRLLNEEAGTLLDPDPAASRARLETLSTAAMEWAVDAAEGRVWGEVHAFAAPHALGSLPVLGRLLRLDLGPIAHGGSPDAILAMSPSGGPPFASRFGPSQRHVVDLGDPERAGFVLPGGQSGNPLSRHYRDQLSLWRAGELVPLPLDRETASRRAVYRSALHPADD